MSIGEIISAIALCASSLDDDKDHLLMVKNVYSIEVKEKYIEVYFVDGNTSNIRIYSDGRVEYL